MYMPYLLSFIVFAAVGAVGQDVSTCSVENPKDCSDDEITMLQTADAVSPVVLVAGDAEDMNCFTEHTPEAAANQAAAAAEIAATTKATATAAWATKSAAAAVMQATGRKASAIKRASAIKTSAFASAAKKETRMLKKAVADAAIHRAKHMKVIYHERSDEEAEIIRKTHATMVKIEADHKHGLEVAKHAMDKQKSDGLAYASGTSGLRAAEGTVLSNTKAAFAKVRQGYVAMMAAAKAKYGTAKAKASTDSAALQSKLEAKALAVRTAAEKLALHNKDKTINMATAKEEAEKAAAEAKRQQELGKATSASKIAEMEAWVNAVSSVTGATKNCAAAVAPVVAVQHNCDVLPVSMNVKHNANFANGCPGAVFRDGTASQRYCNGQNHEGTKQRFPWWAACCTWNAAENLCKTKAA